MTEEAQILGSVFVKDGYAFLYLFRRGEGLSADQGSFIGDLLQREEAAKGEESRKHLQFVLMTTDHFVVASAIRSRFQRETKLAVSAASATAAQYQLISESERHDENTATRLGRSR